MQTHDRAAFFETWLGACEVYGRNAIPSDAALEMVFAALSRYELDDIRRALQAHMLNPDEGRFAPKPADLIRHMVGDSASIAQQAWSKVLRAIERVGTYESIVFDDALTMAVIEDMGGWLDLNKVTYDELPFKQNEFVTRYRGYLNHAPSSHPKMFVGLADAENALQGIEPRSPKLWGDAEKCRLVYETGGEKKPKAITLEQHLGNNVVQLLNTRKIGV